MAIGALPVAVAIRLGLGSRDLLIGRSAAPRELGVICSEIERTPAWTRTSSCSPRSWDLP